MNTKTQAHPPQPTCKAQVPEPDTDALRALVNRRLALRLGLTLPVAATVAALAGLGPQTREAR